MKIHGIQCDIDDQGLVKTIRQVLKQIKERKPKDFERIKSLMKLARWCESADLLNEGEAMIQSLVGEEFPWTSPCELIFTHGVVDTDTMVHRAIVAHELGHAATTNSDIETLGIRFVDRGWIPGGHRQNIGYNWITELLANRYAYQWGFAQELLRAHETGAVESYLSCAGACDKGFGIRIDKSYRVRRI